MAESEETGLERQSLSALGSVSGSPVASDSDGESTSSFEIIEDPENPSVSRSSLIYNIYSLLPFQQWSFLTSEYR